MTSNVEADKITQNETNTKKVKLTKKSKFLPKSQSNNQYSNVIYVGHLHHSITQPMFYEFFANFGPIKNHRLSKNPKTGKSRHYGFIEYQHRYSISLVSKILKNFKLMNTKLIIKNCLKSEIHPKMFWGFKRLIDPEKGLRTYVRSVFNRTKLKELLVKQGEEMEDKISKRHVDRRLNRIENREKNVQDKLNSLGIDYEIPKKSKKK